MDIDLNQLKQKVKDHVEKHKLLYSSVTTGVVFAGITVLIMRSNIARGEMGRGNARGEFTNTASFNFKNKGILNELVILKRLKET